MPATYKPSNVDTVIYHGPPTVEDNKVPKPSGKPGKNMVDSSGNVVHLDIYYKHNRKPGTPNSRGDAMNGDDFNEQGAIPESDAARYEGTGARQNYRRWNAYAREFPPNRNSREPKVYKPSGPSITLGQAQGELQEVETGEGNTPMEHLQITPDVRYLQAANDEDGGEYVARHHNETGVNVTYLARHEQREGNPYETALWGIQAEGKTPTKSNIAARVKEFEEAKEHWYADKKITRRGDGTLLLEDIVDQAA